MLKSNYEKKEALRAIKEHFWHINWIKTIWFNLMALPFSQAIKIPFIVGYNTKIRNFGKIILKKHCFTGMVSLGVIRINPWETSYSPHIFSNKGILSFNGRTKFHPGSKIVIGENAVILLGERCTFGYDTKIISLHSIVIGNDFRMSWNGQILDTDFHFFKKINPQKIYPRKKPIVIGDNVFAGNNVTIGKGTNIPNGCVISCCSKIAGDFSEEGENILVSGNPAKVLSKGYEMGNGWFPHQEAAIARDMEEADNIKKYNKMLLKSYGI